MSSLNPAASRPTIFFSCVEENYYSKEFIVKDTSLAHISSGAMIVVEADRSITLRAGDTVIFPKNQLAKITKHPVDGIPYRSFSIYFTEETLQHYYATHDLGKVVTGTPRIKLIDKHPLVESLTDSLKPYFDSSDTLPGELIQGKVLEALNVLRTVDQEADALLCHFRQSGKLNIGEFMQKNYSFNISIERFAYLTGRSLATFKRDFQKEFNATPQKWLVQKRLERAHYLIAEEKQKPSHVYLTVGFENLSHFSFAFKKLFGYNPTALTMSFSANKV